VHTQCTIKSTPLKIKEKRKQFKTVGEFEPVNTYAAASSIGGNATRVIDAAGVLQGRRLPDMR
jgi:hypothetical protein